MEWEQYIAGRRSGESDQVGIGEEVKQGSEGSLKRDSSIGYSCQLKSYSTVDREPVKLLEGRLRVY
jgi:hypothetical protein